MALRAGFAEIDITPPVGTHVIGWLAKVVSRGVHDPLYARAAVFESEGQAVAFLQLDTLSVRWKTVEAIRRRIQEACGFPGAHVMISATHNHAGPAVMNCGDVPRDDAYLQTLEAKAVAVFVEAMKNRTAAQIGFGHVYDHSLSYNRRVIMRDGTVKTQETFENPGALCLEGPIDPEIAVLAARAPDGRPLGCLVNFACHPTHHGSDGLFSGGFPGALAAAMQAQGWPITLFLNGAAGNIIFFDARNKNAGRTQEELGGMLSERVGGVLEKMAFRERMALSCHAGTVSLPFRALTEEEMTGRAHGAQRFVDSALYDREIPNLAARIRARGRETAQVQAFGMDELAFVAIPAEYFVELGLRIKEEAYPRRALVVGFANGMLGYVPHAAAFRRGGYETTFGGVSRMAPEAGDLLADGALEALSLTTRESRV